MSIEIEKAIREINRYTLGFIVFWLVFVGLIHWVF